MALDVRMLGRGDAAILDVVAEEVFDGPIDAALTAEFLDDPRHHMAVAIEDGVVVGFASGLHYVHPDKPAELWIDEVGVGEAQRGRGLGKRLLHVLFDHARRLGCVEAWVLTERSNTPAIRLYTACGGIEPPNETVLFAFHLDDPSADEV